MNEPAASAAGFVFLEGLRLRVERSDFRHRVWLRSPNRLS
jgi:hypothetical protein